MVHSVRPIAKSDWEWILEINGSAEVETAPLSRQGLENLLAQARHATAIERLAFLIALDQDAPYQSANFLWFRERYPRFIYIDAAARSLGHVIVGCE